MRLDPDTGTTLQVVRTGIATTDDPAKVSVSVDADSTVAYVAHSPASGFELLRISLADGATSVVAVGLDRA